jgi:hypothetical protein
MLTPLLTATVAAYAVTVLLLRRSILTEKVARRGQHVTREYGVDPFELTRAADIMVRTVDTMPATCRSMKPPHSSVRRGECASVILWSSRTGALLARSREPMLFVGKPKNGIQG